MPVPAMQQSNFFTIDLQVLKLSGQQVDVDPRALEVKLNWIKIRGVCFVSPVNWKIGKTRKWEGHLLWEDRP